MSAMDEETTLRAAGKGADQDGETRHLILKAAQRLFLEKGYKGVSMRDIAEEVHVSQAALYYHFHHGKEELFFAMMEGMMTHWSLQLQQVIAQGGTLRSKLEYIIRDFLSFPFERIMVLMRDIHTLLPESAERNILHQRLATMQHQYDAIFQDAIDSGEIRADMPASFLAQLFGGMLGGTIRFNMLNKAASGSPSEVAEKLVGVLLDGIAKPA